MEIRINVSAIDGDEADGMREALIRALEGFFGMHPRDLATTAKTIGYKMDGLALIGEPSNEMTEWRRVALDKWRHFKGIWEGYEMGNGYGNSVVALDHHAYALVKMVPYLLGMPEEALPELHERVREQSRPLRRLAEDITSMGRPGDPHHHEERLPAYPAEGLDFTDTGYLPTGPVPDAFEHKTKLPLCGEVYERGDFRAECTVDADWPHDEHSNGEWHWRTSEKDCD